MAGYYYLMPMASALRNLNNKIIKFLKLLLRPQIAQITRIMLPITAAKAAIMLDFLRPDGSCLASGRSTFGRLQGKKAERQAAKAERTDGSAQQSAA
jgi:hypothetical protein